MWMTANIKTVKNCAFCRHWYDPINETIQPVNPRINIWKYETKVKKKCADKGMDMLANAKCGNYVCKLEIR